MKVKLLFLAFVWPLAVFAEGKDPRADMHVLAQEISALQKYMLSETSFADPKNAEGIRKSLQKMNEHTKKISESAFPANAVLKANAALLASHLADTERLFESGNKAFSRYMLQSSMQMCIACHTREKSLDFALPPLETQSLPPLDRANYFFATRQFDQGSAAFREIVAAYPQNQLSTPQLRSALMALVVYYARVKEDPAEAAKYFGKVAERQDLPGYLRSELKAWAGDFLAWSKEKEKAPPVTELELLGRARQLLASDDFSLIGDSDRRFHVRRLRASALLHRLLEVPGGPSPLKAQATLLLGQIYQRISYNLFFRFGEMYLKACVREYKKTKVARDCYDALEQAVSEGYTGSSGTNIPEEAQVELFQLKRLAY